VEHRESEGIRPESLIPDILRAYPQTRLVFDRYGLKGCGGPEGPPETVAWFAGVHGVDLDTLLAELREAASRPAPQTPAPVEPSRADTIYRPFFGTAAAIGVGFGALWGALVLAVMGITGEMQFAVPYGWILAHAQAMLVGFVVLMAMGFSYQAFPRFKHTELRAAEPAMTSLYLVVAGLALQVVAHLWVPPPVFQEEGLGAPLWALAAGTAGAGLQAAGVLLYVVIVLGILRSGKGPEPHDPLIVASLLWLLLSSLATIPLFLHWGTVTDADLFVRRVGRWNAALRDAQIFGFAGQLILAVSLRLFPHAYGFVPPSPAWTRRLLVGWNAGVLAAVVASPLALLSHDPVWNGVLWAAYLLLALLLWGHVRATGILGRTTQGDRSLKFLRAAFLWGLVGMVMILAFPLYLRATGQSFSHNYYAAYRHALLGGFVLLMIIGVASKVAPNLAGVERGRVHPLTLAFLLLNVGNALRIAGQILMDSAAAQPGGLLAAVGGFLQWGGMLLWAEDLWRILRGRPEAAQSPPVSPGPKAVALGPQATVGEIVAAHPATLEVFLRHGFAPLRNEHFRNTVARTITLEQACEHHGLDLDELLRELRRTLGEE
jgi:hypothetical protein